VAVPQAHLPGAEAEGDFGELAATIVGVLTTLWLFVMRLPHSGKAFHVAFATRPRRRSWKGTSRRSPTSVASRHGSVETGTQSYRARHQQDQQPQASQLGASAADRSWPPRAGAGTTEALAGLLLRQ
jgi:hypothetical protein